MVPERRAEGRLKLLPDVATRSTAKDLQEQVRELTGNGFDLVFEASGAPPALRGASTWCVPAARSCRSEPSAQTTFRCPPTCSWLAKSIYIGSMRYGDVFGEAIRLVASRRVNLRPVISSIFPFAQVDQALHFAADKSQALKVQIQLEWQSDILTCCKE